MHTRGVDVYLDFVDPLSYLLHQRIIALAELGSGTARSNLRLLPFEMRPHPLPLIASDAAQWQTRWTRARELDRDRSLPIGPRELVPWTLKAHELVRHATRKDAGPAVRELVFRACLIDGKDIGRIDVLVELAVEAGLDRTETKAVLDVDKFADDVRDTRDRAWERGVREPATVVGPSDTIIRFRDAPTALERTLSVG